MDEYIGVIKPFVGNYAPSGWLLCDGSLQQIQYNQALFTIIGTTYGGNGVTTFGLPDLRSRIPLDMGTVPPLSPRHLGDKGGTEAETIISATFPTHTHVNNGLNGPRESNSPANNYLGIAAGNFYCQLNPGDSLLPMNQKVISVAPGGSATHNNMSPFLVVNFIICVEGLYPVRP
jgi:microcystin-dependent protein